MTSERSNPVAERQGRTRADRDCGDQKTPFCLFGIQAIKSAMVVGFADLGMEAIYEFEVKDMPVTVAVDSNGSSIHTSGPKEWQIKIAAMHNDGVFP